MKRERIKPKKTLVDAGPGGWPRPVLTQTAALLVDAYRQLNASALFWVALILSGLVVAALATIGIDADGINVLGLGLLDAPTSNMVPPATFYKALFTTVGVTLPFIAWLTVWGVVLALISTASIFPDLVAGGSIDLYLSKPIGRLRLFLTKYVTGLLFVALQVLVFCVGGFLMIGLRGGEWAPGVFLAVPLVLLFFSYLYAVSVLVGVWTGSALAAVLVTALVWLGLTGVQYTETGLLMIRTAAEVRAESAQAAAERFDDILESQSRDDYDAAADTTNPFLLQRDAALKNVGEAEASARRLANWHRLTYAAYAVLPKTTTTADLLERWVVDAAGMDPGDDAPAATPALADADLEQVLESPRTQDRIRAARNERSATWVIGTSLAFEAVLVALAAWLFVRRDY